MSDGYIELFRKIWDELLEELNSIDQKDNYEITYKETIKDLTNNISENYQTIFEVLIDDYIKDVKAIAKLQPGLATGLKDIKDIITLNIYTGYTSDKSNAQKIIKNTF